MKTNEIVKDYLYKSLFPKIFSATCPKFININTDYVRYLRDEKSINQNKSEEKLRASKALLLERIERRTKEFVFQGLQPPLYQIDDDRFISWIHPKYEEYTGHKGISLEFYEVVRWMNSLTANEFLLVACLFLKVIGADKIYVTDGSNDSGIDCIGKITGGNLNSFVFFVQSKTIQSGLVRKEAVLSEFGKYAALPHTNRYRDYRNALGLNASVDGCSYCYLFLTNSEFHDSCKDICGLLGIVLRSRYQLAKAVAESYCIEDVIGVEKRLSSCIKLDLVTNLAPLLPKLKK